MATARLASDLNRRVSAKAYDKRMGDAVCPTVGCTCHVIHVPRTVRQLPRRETPVSAYFRRGSKEVHSPNCRFNTPAVITRLVALSRPATGLEGLFEALPQGRLRYRLHILTETLKVARALQTSPPEERQGILEGAQYVTRERLLTPYIRRAKAIAALAMRVDDDEELSNYIQIYNDGNVVRWENFFFHIDDYYRLYRRLKGRFINHPIAIGVKATGLFAPKNGMSNYMVGCWFELGTSRGRRFNIAPRLRMIDERIFNRFKEKKTYIVCGIPTLKDANFNIIKDELKNKNPFSYIDIDISNINQICEYSSNR